MPPRRAVPTPSNSSGMDEFREALAGVTTVLQQQMEATTSRRTTMDPFNLLEKFTKLKPLKFEKGQIHLQLFSGSHREVV